MEALVQLSGVPKRYDIGAAAAVDDVSVQICAGEAVAVARGFRQLDTFQPASRSWPLQGVEGGLLLASCEFLSAARRITTRRLA